jgi:two-component system OmpR family response regulator
MTERDPHILVVDDDREIRDLLARFLRGQGFRVSTARDGREMRRDFDEARYALIVLDLMLPGEDGLSLLRWVRAQGHMPVVMLTAMGEETDRIVGLELGADDYLPKPFNPRELLARIRAVLRRADATEEAPVPAGGFRFAGWRLETARRRLLDPAGVEVALTGNEYELLVALLERPGRVLTREILLDLVHGRATGPFDRAVDVAVSRLRRKLDDDGKSPEIVKTVRGGGYVFAVPVERVGG